MLPFSSNLVFVRDSARIEEIRMENFLISILGKSRINRINFLVEQINNSWFSLLFERMLDAGVSQSPTTTQTPTFAQLIFHTLVISRFGFFFANKLFLFFCFLSRYFFSLHSISTPSSLRFLLYNSIFQSITGFATHSDFQLPTSCLLLPGDWSREEINNVYSMWAKSWFNPFILLAILIRISVSYGDFSFHIFIFNEVSGRWDSCLSYVIWYQ